MRVAIAADHGGFTLKARVAESLRGSRHEVMDFGVYELNPGDDYSSPGTVFVCISHAGSCRISSSEAG